MYTLFDPPAELNLLNEVSKAYVASITQNLPLLMQDEIIGAGDNLGAICQESNQAFLLKEGNLSFSMDGKVLYFFDEGDLIGLDRHFEKLDCKISSDFAVKGDRYDLSTIADQLLKHPELATKMLGLLSCQLSLHSLFVRDLLKDDQTVSPEIRHFNQGEVIITQGDEPDLVYTLVDGSAQATVDGIKVGEIHRDEIFGMLAVMTGTPRTATVTAIGKCMVVGVAKEQFKELIQHRPRTVLKVIEDMSRTIMSLNEQVVGLKRQGIGSL